MNETTHRVHAGDARALAPLADASVALVVTSPPYPMIAMWDGLFSALDPAAPHPTHAPAAAFEAQHRVLDAVWAECHRVLVPGGMLCVNIGDATRTLGGEFRLWSNHARVLRAAEALGFAVLPDILWRKPTNAPNKFMGSGMLPGGAYVTYEHEYILVLRKGGARRFVGEAATRARRESAYFWEERNVWFSDVWTDLLGAGQALARPAREDTALRARSAAFPLELPARLIAMYSMYGDTVLDPFVGTGTTQLAAACAGRSSVGVEREPELAAGILARLGDAPRLRRGAARLAAHRRFVDARIAAGKTLAHHNAPHDVPVITAQERALCLYDAAEIGLVGDEARVSYARC